MLPNTKSLVLPLGLILGAAFLSGAARADTALTFVGGGTPGGDQFIFRDTRGWAFTTDNTITVTSLGWWDLGDDGLRFSHQVGIWNNAGVLLLSATVASGTTDPLIDHFRFTSTLTGDPTLAPGNYVIGGLTWDELVAARLISVCCDGGSDSIATAPGISFIQGRTNNTEGVFGYPSDWARDFFRDDFDPGIFGPSFQFDNATPEPLVPEPSTVLFCGFGCVILVSRYLAYGRARKKLVNVRNTIRRLSLIPPNEPE